MVTPGGAIRAFVGCRGAVGLNARQLDDAFTFLTTPAWNDEYKYASTHPFSIDRIH